MKTHSYNSDECIKTHSYNSDECIKTHSYNSDECELRLILIIVMSVN